MRYLELAVRCARGAAEPVADLLTGLAGGVAVEDPLDVIQARAAGRWDLDDVGDPGDPAWVTVKAYLSDAAGDEAVARAEQGLDDLRRLGLGEIGAPVCRWVAEEDWATAWKQYFKPLPVGDRLIIVPSWEAPAYTLPPGRLPLYLDPGMAFGTGQHPTTSLCLRWLEQLPLVGARVLDVGTGSGILAIAAARLGAAAVLGIDIDPVAAQVAAENVQGNGVAHRVQVARAEIADPVVTDFCAGGPPALVVANLTAAVVTAIAPAVPERLAPGGAFLASGVITEKQAAVTEALVAAGLQVEEVREEGGWVALLSRRA